MTSFSERPIETFLLGSGIKLQSAVCGSKKNVLNHLSIYGRSRKIVEEKVGNRSKGV